jgi:hypothetical protein
LFLVLRSAIPYALSPQHQITWRLRPIQLFQVLQSAAVCHRVIGTYTIRCRSCFYLSTRVIFFLDMAIFVMDWAAHSHENQAHHGCKAWLNDWLKFKSVKHILEIVADAGLKRCNRSAGPANEVGRPTEKGAVQIGTRLLLYGPVTRAVASMLA